MPVSPDVPEVAAAARRLKDSSRTRVGPILGALSIDSTGDANWLRRLLDLAAKPGTTPWDAQDLTVLQRHHHPAPGATKPTERGLQPPVSLLSWLLRNFPVAEHTIRGDDRVASKRRALARRDPDTISEGLSELRRAGGARGWQVLEGPTYPDAYFVTPDALVVVEGKRTERTVTTSTSWMPGRHQMLRHLDAAWEIRGARAVYGLMIVESARGSVAVPDLWANAALATTSDEAVRASLPHRGPTEQEGIAGAFVGVTTWAQIVLTFGLPAEVLE
ncbi:hypothetical protein [Gemmatimonas sp.]|uniref:hypothetical protein n=1 Tax=Gemmatimonas sp. TaxID=1962908 RepID=UPI002869FE28|nr:hypothetical protein [Gemmatimonas sp.]